MGTYNYQPSWAEVVGNLETHDLWLASELRDNLVGLRPYPEGGCQN